MKETMLDGKRGLQPDEQQPTETSGGEMFEPCVPFGMERLNVR